MNIFVQSEKLMKIKNLRGIYFQDAKSFKEKEGMIKLPFDTTLGDFDDSYLNWKCYIHYDKELDDTYIIITKK